MNNEPPEKLQIRSLLKKKSSILRKNGGKILFLTLICYGALWR